MMGCLLLAAGGGQTAAAEWKVGLAAIKITPEHAVHLAGYANRNKPFERVADDLFAKALALEDRAGYRAVLVTSDLIGFAAAVAEPICARIEQKTGLRRDQILINSSHTHTGPALNLNPAPHDNVSTADAERTAQYTRQLQDKVVQVVLDALGRMEPANLAWGTGVVHFVMNRREFTPEGVILGVNPRGPADRTVPILRIDGTEGKLRAVLFGAATHNTTLTGNDYMVSGDYAGFAQRYIEQHHPGAQAQFILGCAGDANPYPRGSMTYVPQHGTALGEEVRRVLGTKLRPVHGPLKTALGLASLPLQPPPPRAELEKQAAGKRGVMPGIAQQMLQRLGRGETLPTHYRAPIAMWQFGNDLTLVGFSGEVVVDYALLTERTIGPNRLWIAAYCNDVFGYLPSARVLREGGYETRGLIAGGVGIFDPKAEEVVAATLSELARQVGRNGVSGK